MKIRQGFVSNSSSSSFIVIGKKLEISEIETTKNLVVVGKYLNEGYDVMVAPDQLMIDFIKKNAEKFIIYDSLLNKEYYEESINLEHLKKYDLSNINIVNINRDYCYSTTLKDLENTY